MVVKIKKPSIIFFGTPDFAVASLAALISNGYNVLAVVTAPDKQAGRGKKITHSPVKVYAESQGLPVLQPEKLKQEAFVHALKAWGADLHVVVAFRMLPEIVWNMPAMGTINVHASLLPAYRGAAPINWALINGESITGLTTFRLKHEIDTGNILLQEQTPILPEDDFGSLYERLKGQGADLLIKTLEKMAEGALTPTPQRITGQEKPAPKLSKDHTPIGWDSTATAISNLIRGLSPVPGAYTFLEGKKIKIFKAAIADFPAGTSPDAGDWDSDGKTYLRFAAKDAWVCLLELQAEGKKRMPVADFLRGWKFEDQSK